MEMQNLKPRRGSDTYRLDDSDDLVGMSSRTWSHFYLY